MLDIKVLGTGCPNCLRLKALCDEVVKEKNLQANVQNVTNLDEIAEWGVFMTPALVVNNRVLSMGKIPTKSTLIHWLEDAAK